jgi:hypothetical protein
MKGYAAFYTAHTHEEHLSMGFFGDGRVVRGKKRWLPGGRAAI